ncbi:MAG: AI-2E family transporter [Acidobacteria bacterium]|nr:MAG: AI-2E family transporter [Acidobacteriota bacterium]
MADGGNGLTGSRVLLTLASLVVVVAGLQAAAVFLKPFLVSAFLAVLSLPLLAAFRRWRLPTWASVLLTMSAVVLVVAGLAALVGGSVTGFIDAAPRYSARLETLARGAESWLSRHGVDVRQWMSIDAVNPGVLFDFIGGSITAVASALSNVVMVLLTMAFILLEAAGFPEKLAAALGHEAADFGRLRRITGEVQRYLAIKTLTSLATAVLITLWLLVLGVDFPLLWGLTAFVMNFIPTLGSILAAVPAILLAAVQHGPANALLVMLGYVAVNMVIGNIVEPQLMGRRLGLSPLVVFLSLVFWGWVWGPVGMLLSVPLTMIVKIMLEHTDDLRWIAILLDASPPARSRG